MFVSRILLKRVIVHIVVVIDVLENGPKKRTRIQMKDGRDLTDVGSIQVICVNRHMLEGMIEIQFQMLPQIQIQCWDKTNPFATASIGIINTITEIISNVKPDITLRPEPEASIVICQIKYFSTIHLLKHSATQGRMGLHDSTILQPQSTIFQKQVSICFLIIIQFVPHHKGGPPATGLSNPRIMCTTLNVPLASAILCIEMFGPIAGLPSIIGALTGYLLARRYVIYHEIRWEELKE